MSYNMMANRGRLGNQVIAHLALSLLAEKHDLSVSYKETKDLHTLGIKLFSGNKIYKKNTFVSGVKSLVSL